MRKVIIVLLSCFCFSIQAQTDTVIINAGRGVDNIVVEKSSQKEVSNFKKIKFIKEKRIGLICGKGRTHKYHAINYVNDSVGLKFKFRTSLDIRTNFKLNEITISKKGKTTDGLVIGKSTKEEVVKLYGLETDWQKKDYIVYDDNGISFLFDSNGIISEIEIFKHSFILVNESW